ncbi:MAG: hypothetical protein HY553_11310 [Elusimicrobia bacterium]|nr:hypothetical protein [Elusimicrobiota bacterium]
MRPKFGLLVVGSFLAWPPPAAAMSPDVYERRLLRESLPEVSRESPFDWNYHNQRRHELLEAGDTRAAMAHCDAIFAHSTMDPYILDTLSGWEKEPARALRELRRYALTDLPFLRAAVLLRQAELLRRMGTERAAEERYAAVLDAADADPRLEPYEALAWAAVGDPAREPDRTLWLLKTKGVLGSSDVRRNRRAARETLTRLSLEEARAFMDAVRAQKLVRPLVNALLALSQSARNAHALTDEWVRVLEGGRADFLVEVLTYVEYASTGVGTVYFPGRDTVDIYDYDAAVGAVVHESCHGFMDEHGLEGNAVGLNEGFCIALPKYIESGQGDIAEAVFGTVLFYRDVGLRGYPTQVAIGDANTLDAKGQAVARFLMRHDPSGIDWFDARGVRCLYDRVWSKLDRDVEWNAWLSSVDQATAASRVAGCF